MSTRRNKFLITTLLVTVTLTAIAFVSARTGDHNTPAIKEMKAEGESPKHISPKVLQTSAKKDNRAERVNRGMLHRRLLASLDVLGDRLERKGKERLTLIGTLRLAGESQAVPVRIVGEFPDRLRLEIGGQGARVLTFDGEGAWKDENPLDQLEQSIMETVANDSIDHFFSAQMEGSVAHFIGPRFRMDDGQREAYNGPFYDVYQIVDTVRFGQDARQQVKLYYFNSDTQLLERVRYEVERDGAQVKIEVRLTGWQRVNNQQIPGRITRLENNQTVLTLAIESAGVEAKANDRLFDKPQQ
jgi:hypothetical protein